MSLVLCVTHDSSWGILTNFEVCRSLYISKIKEKCKFIHMIAWVTTHSSREKKTDSWNFSKWPSRRGGELEFGQPMESPLSLCWPCKYKVGWPLGRHRRIGSDPLAGPLLFEFLGWLVLAGTKPMFTLGLVCVARVRMALAKLTFWKGTFRRWRWRRKSIMRRI